MKAVDFFQVTSKEGSTRKLFTIGVRNGRAMVVDGDAGAAKSLGVLDRKLSKVFNDKVRVGADDGLAFVALLPGAYSGSRLRAGKVYDFFEGGKVAKAKTLTSGKTSTSDNHSHEYRTNSTGDGVTSREDNHTHQIKDYKVMPAEGHTHDLPEERETDLKKFATEDFFAIAKTSEHPNYSYVLAPALVPEAVDHQGDIISAEEIEKAAHDFMADSQQPGLMHKTMLRKHDSQIVESYILRSAQKFGKITYPAGTWFVGMRVYNPEIRKRIREGKLTGFSIGGRGKGVAP